MKTSTERILTTHVGSLCRPADITEALRAQALGEEYDRGAFEGALPKAVLEVVASQRDAGIDVPSDGEFGKTMWTGYIRERLGGLEHTSIDHGDRRTTLLRSLDREHFPEFYAVYDSEAGSVWIPEEVKARHPGTTWSVGGPVACTGPITYTGQADVQRDIANFKQALAVTGIEEGFLPLAAPGSVEAGVGNQYYGSDEAFLEALARALAIEYRAVVDAGLVLQVDDAFIPYNYERYVGNGMSMEDYRRHCEVRIEAVNAALAGIPRDRVRYHVCWGSWAGPHAYDVPMREIVDLIVRVDAGAFSFEAANPRHEFEWEVWREVELPDDTVLIPGVVTHSTNVVEHPETVAQRIIRFADIVGPDRVVAGTDCGFSQGWNMPRTHPTVQWAKLRALAEGATLASQRLFAVR